MFSCDICHRQFLYKNSVNRHIFREHIHKESRRKLKCTACDHECRFYHDLRTHMQEDHDIVCNEFRRTFSDVEEFKNWKRKFEETSHYMYVKHSSPKISTTTHERKTYFVCHRTGNFQSGSCGKRKLKRQGSNKINASCPSTMEVVESLTNGTVKLVLWETHVGHDAEVTRTFLSANERNWLAARITEGASYQEIMDEIQTMGSKGGRMCYIKSQDIRNMRKNLINTRNRNILSNIRSWVKNTQNLSNCDDNTVMFFKDRNIPDENEILSIEDLMLIVMTPFQKATFKTLDPRIVSLDVSAHQDNYEYNLISLCATNGYNWCPFIYCITSVVDNSSIEYFLSRVKKKLGHIWCTALLCDDTLSIYEAWCNVMSVPTYHFLHSWYVQKSWQANLSGIKHSDSVKNTFYRTMKQLLTEQSELVFEKRLNALHDNLKSDVRNAEFLAFFSSTYLCRIPVWGGCYRKIAGLSNIGEISLLKVYKKIWNDFHINLLTQDFSGCLNNLLSFSHNCEPVCRQIEKMTLREDIKRRHRIQNGHRQGVCIKRTQIQEISATQYRINYKSENSRNESYEIRYLGPNPCKCILRCNICSVCIHNYSCSCIDYVANLNICKHIHACAIIRNKIKVDLSADTDAPLDSFVEEVICEEEIVCNVENIGEDNDYLKDEIEDENQSLLEEKTTSSVLSDVKSDDYQTLLDLDEYTRTSEDFIFDANSLKASEDLNIDAPSIFYYEPFAFASTLHSYDEEQLQLVDDDLQMITSQDGNEFEAVLINDDDCSSFGDSSSGYEDVLPTKVAIIDLSFREDSSSNFIFERFDNKLIKHKSETLFTLPDFEGVDNEINKQLTSEISEMDTGDFEICFGTYDTTNETILNL